MGSVIGLVGDSAADRATIHYDGFGNVRRVSGSPSMAALPADAGGDFRFQGMWSDVGTGLYYVRARVYDAQTGRFLSRDPAEGRREDPSGYLPYVFAQNAPTLLRDPTGRVTLTEIQTILTVRTVQLLGWVGRTFPVLAPVTKALIDALVNPGAGSGAPGPLRQLFGVGVDGAQRVLQLLNRGVVLPLPPGITMEVLFRYQILAQRIISLGLDKSGLQAQRLEIVRRLLQQIEL
jgi:RHS repeat-associated protein